RIVAYTAAVAGKKPSMMPPRKVHPTQSNCIPSKRTPARPIFVCQPTSQVIEDSRPSGAAPYASALHRADHDALFEVALQERVQDDHRKRGDDDHPVLDLVGILLGVTATPGAAGATRTTGEGLIGDQDVPEHDLERLLLIIAHENQAGEEV